MCCFILLWKPWYFFFFQDFLINRKFERTTFIWNRNLIQHFQWFYCQCWSINACLLNKSINFIKVKIKSDSKLLNGLLWNRKHFNSKYIYIYISDKKKVIHVLIGMRLNIFVLFQIERISLLTHLAVVLLFVLKHFLDVKNEGEVTLGEMMAELLDA